MPEYNPIFQVREKYESQLLKLANVISVGIGPKKINGIETSEMAICVDVRIKLPLDLLEKADIIPAELEGFQTDVNETGLVKIHSDEPEALQLPDRRQRLRPPRGGYSIGNIKITAGTLGCLVYKGEQEFILSNAHVLTPDATSPFASAIAIVQPGIYDGGVALLDQVAELEDYKIIEPFLDLSTCEVSIGLSKGLSKIAQTFRRQSRFMVLAENSAVNTVDAAIARPTEIISPIVEGIGVPNGVYHQPSPLSLPVIKSGRTTGITRGKITQIEVTVNVQYSQFQMVQFRKQLKVESTTPFSQPGDSGSIVFVEDEDQLDEVVGLLFAGNENGTATFLNPIEEVLKELKVTLLPS